MLWLMPTMPTQPFTHMGMHPMLAALAIASMRLPLVGVVEQLAPMRFGSLHRVDQPQALQRIGEQSDLGERRCTTTAIPVRAAIGALVGRCPITGVILPTLGLILPTPAGVLPT